MSILGLKAFRRAIAWTAAVVAAASSASVGAGLQLQPSTALIAGGQNAGDRTGQSIAATGDTLVVGAPLHNGVGGAFVWVRSGSSWAFQQELAPTSASGGDEFGTAVAIAQTSGGTTTIIVGAPNHTAGKVTGRGAAFVFTRAAGATTWSTPTRLLASDAATNDHYGAAVALATYAPGFQIPDTYAVVGAAAKGAAYVSSSQAFSGTWSAGPKLTGDEGATSRFGYAVAMSGGNIVVGAPDESGHGAVYVFSPGGARQVRFLSGSHAFGTAVAVSGNTFVTVGWDYGFCVCTPQPPPSAYAAFYTKSGGTWSTQGGGGAIDSVDDAKPFLATAVMNGNIAAFGRPSETTAGWVVNNGDATVFVRRGGQWNLSGSTGETATAQPDAFGASVALAGPDMTQLLVGAPYRDLSTGTVDIGIVYTFQVARDFGDAQGPYPTQLADDGARHLASDVRLGSLLDVEADGQPGTGSSGDDTTGDDDEDGAVFTNLSPGAEASVQVTVAAAAGSAKLDGWIDFNGDGVWDDTTERVFDHAVVSAGVTDLPFAVPADATLGDTVARLRVSTDGVAAPTGSALDGEVEDYAVTIGSSGSEFVIEPVADVLESAGKVTVTVARIGSALGAVTVDYDTESGSAKEDVDFGATSGTLYFPDGVVALTFDVNITDDTADEGRQTFDVFLSDPSAGATLGDDARATIGILDDDLRPHVRFARARSTTSERNHTRDIIVKLSNPSDKAVTVGVAVGGTAQPEDFSVPTQLRFPPGVTEKALTVTIVDDVLPEGDENVVLHLTDPANAKLGAVAKHTLRIVDDDL